MSTSPSPPPSEPPVPPRSDTGTVLIVVGVVVAVIIGFVAIGLAVNGSSQSSAASTPSSTPVKTPSSPTTPAAPTTPPASTPPANLPALHCQPAPPKPAKPQQFAKAPSPSLAQDSTWRATLNTNCGAIVMDLEGRLAPQTVSSFIFLSEQKFYNDSPCHRLTTTGLYVLQCGDPTGTGSGGPGYGYGIENAPADGQYPTGTVAMARTEDPNSNGSQFFIVYSNTTLPTTGGGYSIFGKVVKGLPIVQALAAKGLASDGTAPAQPISILTVALKKL